MVNIQNASTIKEIRSAGGLSISEGFPQKLGDNVIPVVNVNPSHNRIQNIIMNSSSANTTTIYTTPNDARRFYLCNVSLSGTNTVATAGTVIAISVIIAGVSSYVIFAHLIPNAVDKNSVTLEFTKPIAIDRNTAIQAFANAAVSNMRASITGYLVDEFET